MERLEEYIRKNREDLDKYEPSPGVWKAIRRNMRRSIRETLVWLSAAAMIAVVFGTSILFYVTKDRDNYALSKREAILLMMKNNPELLESEIYYNTLINDLYTEAAPLLTGFPDLEKELLNDMSQLDSIMADIKKDLRDNVDNQEVIEAMISNYRIKTRILEDMLDVLKNDENNPEKETDNAI